MTTAKAAHSPAPETTDLERRVLAHERILQSLIAYMSRADVGFVEHLRERFVEPMSMAVREHDHRDSDDYAEEFIRAVMLLGEVHTRRTSRLPERAGPQRTEDHAPEPPVRPEVRLDRVQLRDRNGVWEVRVDGAFRGDYQQEEHALAAAALARLSLR